MPKDKIKDSDFGNYKDKQKTLIDTKKREYSLAEFPGIIDFPKDNINKINIDNIEIKSNVNIISKAPKINIEDNEYELQLNIDGNTTGNIYIDMNVNSNSKETEIEIELGENVTIEGNLYVNINSNNDESKETELEIEGSDSNKAYGIINGLIYAPGSKIELEDGIKINGGVVGNNVEVEDRKTIITYDPKYI